MCGCFNLVSNKNEPIITSLFSFGYNYMDNNSKQIINSKSINDRIDAEANRQVQKHWPKIPILIIDNDYWYICYAKSLEEFISYRSPKGHHLHHSKTRNTFLKENNKNEQEISHYSNLMLIPAEINYFISDDQARADLLKENLNNLDKFKTFYNFYKNV